MVVLSIEKDGKSSSWQSSKIDQFALPVNRWKEIETTFNIPEGLDGESTMLVYIWNPGRKFLYIDDLRISFDD